MLLSAAAAQWTQYTLHFEDTRGSTDTYVSKRGDDIKAIKKQYKNDGWILQKQETLVIADPVSWALNTVKSMTSSALKAVREEYKIKKGAGKFEFVLSDSTNHRFEVATVLGYKENRKDLVKPTHFEECKRYVKEQFGAFVCENMEADDYLSIQGWEAHKASKGDHDLVLIHVDKDIDQVPGLHYNPTKKVHYTVTVAEARELFLKQILTGDMTDNIVGIWKVGEVGAQKLVEEFDRRQLRGEELWDAIVTEYNASRSKKGCPYSDKDPEAVALEMARLVKLQEYKEHMWQPIEL